MIQADLRRSKINLPNTNTNGESEKQLKGKPLKSAIENILQSLARQLPFGYF